MLDSSRGTRHSGAPMTQVAIILLLIGVVLVLAVLLVRARRPRHAAPGDPLRSTGLIDHRHLAPGDIVTFAGRDLVVRGTLHLDEDGFRWAEHLLDDAAGGRMWLSVEDDEDLEVVVWEAVDAPELTPGAPRLDHDGTSYARRESGRAAYRAEGTTGTPERGEIDYQDYASGERRLSFERAVGDSWEVSVGTRVSPGSVVLYPRPRSERGG